jgi:hypothetical protein
MKGIGKEIVHQGVKFKQVIWENLYQQGGICRGVISSFLYIYGVQYTVPIHVCRLSQNLTDKKVCYRIILSSLHNIKGKSRITRFYIV